MRICEVVGGGVLTAALTLVAPMALAVPNELDSPPNQGGTQVGVTSSVRQRYEALRQRARPPLRGGFRLAKGESKSIEMQGVLHTFEEGNAMLAVPLTDEQASVLKRVGAKIVSSAANVRHHTIFEGRYYRLLKVAPLAGQPCAGCVEDRLTGPDPRQLERRVGQTVKLVTQRDQDGRSWVVGLRP